MSAVSPPCRQHLVNDVPLREENRAALRAWRAPASAAACAGRNTGKGTAGTIPSWWARASRSSGAGTPANPARGFPPGPRRRRVARLGPHRARFLGRQQKAFQIERRQVAVSAPVELRIGKRGQHGALVMAWSNKARSSRSNSAAVRTRMPAALSRYRAASREERVLPVEPRELLLHHPAHEHTGRTHWRASPGLITWTTCAVRPPTAAASAAAPISESARTPRSDRPHFQRQRRLLQRLV